MRSSSKVFLWIVLILMGAGALVWGPAAAPAAAQQPTGSIPTVTGTPTGVFATVTYEEPINVRAGPSSVYYPRIGASLYPGQVVPVLGRTAGGEWIQIYYPGVPGNVGWVYAPLVTLSPGFVPIVEPPPTATPRTTPTIDPTLQAAFQAPLTPTRLPTFTPPPALVIPTFEAGAGERGAVPMGLIIFGLIGVGLFGALISFLRGR
ncbi:MAG: SH3 domain-containing protein [Anaerolineales bacterium]